MWNASYDLTARSRFDGPMPEHVHSSAVPCDDHCWKDQATNGAYGSGCCRTPGMSTSGAKHSYDSLATCVNDLQERGYDTDLEVNERGLVSRVRSEPLDPEKFTIDEFYRFEGTSDPADMSIVYAISSEDLGIKGLIVNAFGTYASGVVDRMVSRLDVHANYPADKTQPENTNTH